MKYFFLITLFFLSFNSFAGIQPYNPETDNTEETDVSPLEAFGNVFKSLDESVKELDESLKQDWEEESEVKEGPSNPYAN
jgi:hypothetical protein